MIYGHNATPKDLDLRADVCVVGSGAGGSVIAKKAAERGLKVVVLEEGGFYTKEDFDQLERDMLPKLYKQGTGQATADGFVSVLQGRCVGGTTVVNYLCCFRTPGRVLGEWAERGVQGMSPADMKPHLDEVWDMLSIQKMPENMLNPNNRLLKIGAERLGWKGDTFWRNQIGCWGSGFCAEGCAYDAKQSALLTYLHEAVIRGADVYAGARVERITLEGGRATGVEGIVWDPETDTPRGRLRVKADVTVVSCGSINTPELLLRSNVGGPMVGKSLYLHPVPIVWALFDREIHNYYGIKQGYYIDEFSDVFHDDLDGGYVLEGVGAQPGLGAVGMNHYGTWHRERMKEHHKLALVGVLVRDRDGGTVSLDKDGRRRIEYWPSRRDLQKCAEGMKHAAEVYLAAGAKEVYTCHAKGTVIRSTGDLALIDQRSMAPGEMFLFSAHQMGTCRMGEDPETSVVNSNGRVHTTKNLLIADASAFPTPSGVNPQVTVYAVATHHAKVLLENWNEIAAGKA